ncbi:hypothetical protein ZYGR_0I00420 [Zygosaccharomyces rouxii]|uniref:ZYRO0C01034p n=2 Tax=Zygosaccharomyces rouxii TaxID=4956 RepID=C5DSL0_ZYGRC|nr:uncharacterized protein ZYRO0C01034g [Zygosaccharomyces rouxii]KAH9202039.1 hypothetical protein LQ764DRAFT_92343 [Zygosaccharomyces rouxii]GAV47746.1 hypothetical protein ZYGR_0I00420 [Zygosaccharomyces rouxii]CAR26771.1 ZYRO0C01034p [Zygosaccharomyces rouxii]
MTIRDSIETHFVGPKLEIQNWSISDWVLVSKRILILGSYAVLHTIVKILQKLLQLLVNNPIIGFILVINGSLWRLVPIVGRYAGRILPKIISYVKETLIPSLGKFIQLIQLSFQLHIVQMTLKNKKNIQIFITAESDDLELFDSEENLKTTLLLSNHRSINDYLLINYLVQSCSPNTAGHFRKRHLLKQFWERNQLPIPPLNFISWGKICNFPHISFVKNILTQDENTFVPPRKIKEHLKANGNQILAIFPEVNIMTTELAIVQRKLNQDYPFVTRFYNVLYPRFRNFISLIKCFANINHVKRRQHNTLFDHAKFFFENGMDKLIYKTSAHGKQRDAGQEQANAAMIVGLPNSLDHVEMTLSDESPKQEPAEGFSNTDEQKESVSINPYLYDLTIVYYRPKYTSTGHDHVHGRIKIHNGYQLEQVNPSLLEMLKPEGKSLSSSDANLSILPPIVVMVHIKKHELDPLLPTKGRNLEKWLEVQWYEKDKLIDSIENGIRIK